MSQLTTLRTPLAIILIAVLIVFQSAPAIAHAEETEQVEEAPLESSEQDTTVEESEHVEPAEQTIEQEAEEETAEKDAGDSPSEDVTIEIVTTGTSTEEETFENALDVVTAVVEELAHNADGDEGMDGSAPTSSPEILSGEAVAMANIMNIVNTSVVNSSGAIVFSNFFDPVSSDIDFRNASTTDRDTCVLLLCGENVDLKVFNDAFIENFLHIFATSGSNAIDAPPAGGGLISTGNAYAGLNLVNVANANFVDSNYLLVTVNAFEGIDGDIVFPSLEHFFSAPLFQPESAAIKITNDADVENEVEVDAEAGNNSIENSGEDGGAIETGDSNSSSNVFNQINTSLVGGTSMMILFKVHGSWAGTVFNAPENVAWSEAEDGSIFLYETASSTSDVSGTLNAVASSTAKIKNNVSVIALTGENKITGAETALIRTGNAYAGANIVNIANAQVIGRNWLLAIINIFGDFNGNISFGRPDVWVGEQIETPTLPMDGETLVYKITVINNGDANASHVVLTDSFDEAHLDLLNSSLAYELTPDGNLIWQLGGLPSGGAIEITYTAKIKNAPGGTPITNTVTASSYETDNNLDDNTDTATVTTVSPPSIPPPGGQSGGGGGSYSPVGGSTIGTYLSVDRLTASTTLPFKVRSARQELVFKNISSGDLTNAVLYDVLKDPSGSVMSDERWDLGKVVRSEEIRIGYDINFASSSPWGVYDLTTIVWSDQTGTTTFAGNGSIFLLPPPPEMPIPQAPIKEVLAVRIREPIMAPGIPVESTRKPPETPPKVQVAAAAAATESGSTVGYLYLLTLALGGLSAIAYVMLRRERESEEEMNY